MSVWRHSPHVAVALLVLAGCSGSGDDELALVTGPSTSVDLGASTSTSPGGSLPDSTDVTSSGPTGSATPGSGPGAAAEGATTTTASTGRSTTAAPSTTVRTPTTVRTSTSSTTTATTRPTPATTTLPGPTTTTTIAPLRPESLVLGSAGIGPVAFGASDTVLVNSVGQALGAPISDELIAYPVPFDGQFATDEFGDELFAHPLGRETCYPNGLCTYAGGPASGPLAFVGWTFSGDAPPALVTASGVTVESRWADFPTMTVDTGGCYSLGTGSVDGILLTILSEGAPFGEFDDDGNYFPGRPDPADAVVVNLEAGTPPRFSFADC